MGGDGYGEEDDSRLGLVVGDHSSSDEAAEESTKRNGSLRTAIAHIITGVIGAGVLSLPWSVAQLGWIAGPVLLAVLFPAVTFISAFLMCDCYRYPDPEFGHLRIKSYPQAVKLHLGEKKEQICTVIMVISLWFTGVAYHITTASSIRAIDNLICYHKQGHEASSYSCTDQDSGSYYTITFGASQIMLSQIPDMHNMGWLSVFATIMSFCYATIGFALGFAQVLENGSIKGSISGIPAPNLTEKLLLAFEALGDIAFAYPYSLILLDIQDTLKSPPPENQTMKKASTVAISVTTFFYLCCACFGYAALGDATPGNLLTGSAFYEPFWLVAFANACVVLHLLGGYQIFSQPVFSMVDRWTTRNYPNNAFVNKQFSIKLPILPGFQLHLFRVCFRTAYVLSTTSCAVLFPYFNQVLGLIGALNFWPLAIYFPVEMFLKQRKIRAWTTTWIAFRVLSFLCFVVTVMGVAGSLERIFSAKFS